MFKSVAEQHSCESQNKIKQRQVQQQTKHCNVWLDRDVRDAESGSSRERLSAGGRFVSLDGGGHTLTVERQSSSLYADDLTILIRGLDGKCTPIIQEVLNITKADA